LADARQALELARASLGRLKADRTDQRAEQAADAELARRQAQVNQAMAADQRNQLDLLEAQTRAGIFDAQDALRQAQQRLDQARKTATALPPDYRGNPADDERAAAEADLAQLQRAEKILKAQLAVQRAQRALDESGAAEGSPERQQLEQALKDAWRSIVAPNLNLPPEYAAYASSIHVYNLTEREMDLALWADGAGGATGGAIGMSDLCKQWTVLCSLGVGAAVGTGSALITGKL